MTSEPTAVTRHARAAAAEEARAAATAAAARAGVSVRLLRGAAECAAGAELLGKIWGVDANSAPLTSDVLTSFLHAGGCVLGAFRQATQATLAGLAVGVAGRPGSATLYSLIAGVDEAVAGSGAGQALKQAQRAWALDAGAVEMVWTFDPLIRRNAHFNLTRLGARVTGYLPDFYPPMYDQVNRGDLTDRLAVSWDLLQPQPGPVEPSPADAMNVEIPADIEAVRVADPDEAMRWRLLVREAMLALFGGGARLDGLTADGRYAFVPVAGGDPR